MDCDEPRLEGEGEEGARPLGGDMEGEGADTTQDEDRFRCPHYKRKCKFVVSTFTLILVGTVKVPNFEH